VDNTEYVWLMQLARNGYLIHSLRTATWLRYFLENYRKLILKVIHFLPERI